MHTMKLPRPCSGLPRYAPSSTPPGPEARAQARALKRRPTGRELFSPNAVNNSSPPPPPASAALCPPPLPLWLRPCRRGPPTHLPGTAEPSTLRDLAACFRRGRWVRDSIGEVRGTTSSLSSVPATNSPAAERASGGSHTTNNRAARGGGCQSRRTHAHTQRGSEGTKLGQKKKISFPKHGQKYVSPSPSPPDTRSPCSTEGRTPAG